MEKLGALLEPTFSPTLGAASRAGGGLRHVRRRAPGGLSHEPEAGGWEKQGGKLSTREGQDGRRGLKG